MTMTDVRRVTSDDFNLIPAINGSLNGEVLRVVTLHEFINTHEDVPEPLIGAENDTLLPAGGDLLMYGDGGAGKTTLAIDGIVHLASGTDWLNLQIPKPVNVMLIENEGPRGPFRQTLARKTTGWQGEPFVDNVTVLEEPWTRFTLHLSEYRAAISVEIDRTETDLVVVGPLATLGAKGTGTPDDVNEFTNHIKDLRAGTQRHFALWIVHHENKAGDVSGAWERVPDTLAHVTAQGNGRTRVHWRKARWSSRLHNTSVQLIWGENSGFTIDEARQRDLEQELRDAYHDDDRWRTAREAAGLIGANQDTVRDTLMELVEKGEMTLQIGPPGRRPNAKCWRLRSDSDPPGHHESLDLLADGVGELTQLTHPTSESVEAGHHQQTHATDSDLASQNSPEDDASPNDDRGRWFDE